MSTDYPRANRTRVVNYLLRLEDIEFEKFLDDIRQERIIRGYYIKCICDEFTRNSKLMEAIKGSK
jgi:hypothetical protein